MMKAMVIAPEGEGELAMRAMTEEKMRVRPLRSDSILYAMLCFYL